MLFDMIARRRWEPTDTYNEYAMNVVEELTHALRIKVAQFKNKVIATPEYNISRTENSIDFAEDLNRVENNILAMAKELNYPTGFVQRNTAWSYNQVFDYNDANRLELNLIVLNNYVSGQLNSRPFCGMYTVGQEGVF